MHSPLTPQRVRLAAQVVELLAAVDVDLRARTARTDLGHLPEILLATEEQDMLRVEAGLLLPNVGGFFIGGDIALDHP